MAENPSFFRKVVRFVANPTTDWTQLNSRADESRELDLEKSELKAMIERKRRNDFVRKRELEMLRRVRREGLTPEQVAALGGSSRLDDSEIRSEASPGRPDAGVKAKIDEIEQQMVGDSYRAAARRSTHSVAGALGPAGAPGRRDMAVHSRLERPTEPAALQMAPRGARQPPLPLAAAAPPAGRVVDREDDLLPALPPLPPLLYSADLPVLQDAVLATHDISAAPAAAPAPVQMETGLAPLSPLAAVSFDGAAVGLAADNIRAQNAFALEVIEVVHDPELDEAVIAFANADFTQCEEALRQLTTAGGARAAHAETWLVLFDLYRATGQQQRFEGLALDYAHGFGWSAPQWYSLPKLVADAAMEDAAARPSTGPATVPPGGDDVGWACPPRLDVEAVARLRSQSLQLPLPWVLDWSQITGIDAEAAMKLSALFRLWAGQALEMRWLGGARLLAVLQEAAPTGLRDADPAFWLTRLDALRLANRADEFDEAAIDYCVTYEVSPPSWEAARCKVQLAGTNPHSLHPGNAVNEVSTSFMESTLHEDAAGAVSAAHVELSGQLVGDIGSTLRKIDSTLNAAPVVRVSCSRLIRVDFIAAGDLLNWVLTKSQHNRVVHFVDAHRLVALFFGAMGINEHAKVQTSKN